MRLLAACCRGFTWLSNQTWSNGKIGTIGCSSTAEWQMAVASLDHPAHAAMVPQGFGAGVGSKDKERTKYYWCGSSAWTDGRRNNF